jgi:hypothetical protein
MVAGEAGVDEHDDEHDEELSEKAEA